MIRTEPYDDQYPMPGSPYAAVHGCICPKGGGTTIGRKILVFEVDDDCILHGIRAKAAREMNKAMREAIESQEGQQ